MAKRSLKAGSILGQRYRIQRLLGRGPRGSVYLSQDLRKDEASVAVKILSSKEPSDKNVPELRQRLSLLSRIRHPNLVQLLDFGICEREHCYYIVREFIGGQDLFSATTNYNTNEILHLLIKICRVLQYLHLRGILHLGLKPTNVILPDGYETGDNLRIADFGLINWRDSSRQSGSVDILAYMPPEIILGHAPTARTDLYSLGILAYQLLTRRLPFESDDQGYLIQKHLQGKPDMRPIERLPGGPGLAQALRSLLEKDAARRPSSAEDVVHLLSVANGHDLVGIASETSEIYFHSGRFVGRGRELSFLQNQANHVKENDRGWTTFILGEGGVGKSRLLDEFRLWGLLEGWRVVEASCMPDETESYGPYRRLLADTMTIVTQEQNAPIREEVFRFEDLPRAPQKEQLKMTAESAAGQFRDMLTREIVNRLSDKPTLLFLHDFHWADDATAAVLDFLISDIREHCIMICVSARPGEAEGGALVRVLDRSVKNQRADNLGLESLTDKEVRLLIESILGESRLAVKIGRWMYRASGGNPLFVEETLKHLSDRGLLHRSSDKWDLDEKHLKNLKIPNNIAAVLRQRLGRLNTSAQLVVHWLAAINHAVPLRFLQAVTGKSGGDLTDILAELESSQVVRLSEKAGESMFELRHALISEVVRMDLSKTSLKKMHRRIGEELERHCVSEARVQEIALHYTEGKCGDKAIKYALEAARESKADFAYENALRYYTYVLRNKNNLSKEEMCGVAISAADTACALGNPKQAIRILKSVIATYSNLKTDIQAELFMKLSYSYQHLGNCKEVEAYAQKGLDILGRLGSKRVLTTKAMLLKQLAYCALLKSKPRRGVLLLNRAMHVIAGTGNRILEGQLYAMISATQRVACKLHAAIDAGQKAIKTLKGSEAYYALPIAYSHVGVCFTALGRFASAKAHLQRSVETAVCSRSIILQAQAYGNLAECLCRRGELNLAIDYSNRSKRLALESGNPTIQYACDAILAEIMVTQGKYKEAHRLLDNIVHYSSPNIAVFLKAQVYYLLAWLYTETGFYDYALTQLERLRCLDSAEAPIYERNLGDILRSRIELYRGHTTTAHRILKSVDQTSKRKRWPYQICLARLWMGQVLTSTGHYEKGMVSIRFALRLAEAISSIVLQAQAHLFLGRAFLALSKLDFERHCVLKSKHNSLQTSFIEARKELSAAKLLAEQSGIESLLWQIHTEWATVEELLFQEDLCTFHSNKAIEYFGRAARNVGDKMQDAFINAVISQSTTVKSRQRLEEVRRRIGHTLDIGDMESNHLRFLFKISNEINSIRDIELLTEILADRLLEALGIERVLVFLEVTSDLKPTLVKGRNSKRETLTTPVVFSHFILGEVQMSQKPFVTADAAHDPRIYERKNQDSHYARGTIFCAPLKVYDRMLGVIYADDQSPWERVEESAINLFASFCNLASMAIDNAQAHQQLCQEKAELKQFLHHAQEGYGEMLGQSTIMRKLREHLARVAKSPMDVLIMGETGTGKELVARALHRTGLRSGGPFITLDCGSLADTVAEAEFFGYRKGAFTGALENRAGLLEAAQGGVIFLDEISNLSMKIQRKLLRVLEEREIRRIGETKVRKIDVQVFAATNRDLKREVRKGRFRNDLFFRLYDMEVYVPPLRERLGDVPLLVNHFIEKAAQQCGSNKKVVAKEACSILMRYQYPGNVRELQKIVHRAYHLTHGQIITAEDLPPEVHESSKISEKGQQHPETDSHQIYTNILDGKGNFETHVKKPFLDRHLSKQVVRQIIRRSLMDGEGRYRQAFKLLGVPDKEYRLQLQFLKRHDCFLDYRRFRKKGRNS